MGIWCEGLAKLKILETGEVFEVHPNDLEWEVVDADERSMGAELHYCATFYFYSEQEGFEVEVAWDVWEYPIGSIECKDIEHRECELLQDFEIYSDSLEEVEITFPNPVSIAAFLEVFNQLKIKIQDEYGREINLEDYGISNDGLMNLKISYPSKIPDGDQLIRETLNEQKIREQERQIIKLHEEVKLKNFALERLEKLLVESRKIEISNSSDFQIKIIGEEIIMSGDRIVNLNQGNYNESISGDYIQGNYIINMSQDLTQAATQIQDLIEQLQKQGNTVDIAQEQVAKNLANQAQNNPTKRNELVKWAKSLGSATVSDVVKGAVKLAIRSAGIPLP